MAKEDAAEQVKEVLRQIIKYRFWISVGFAALFAVVAYFMGSGPVQDKAKAEINTIKGAKSAVEAYKDPTKPTPAYQPIVAEKTEIVAKDVKQAWKELYDRQAPLLTWPEQVQDRFRKWGRKWPESEDPGKVRVAIVDYVYAYPAYVDMVYKTFQPFNYETGEGIVSAPPKEALLRPAPFTPESMPGLGKIWAAQERLWIQHTLLEVVAEVNRKAKAKDWSSAIVKEIALLEVGNPDAQDQRSIAKGQQLTEAPDVLAPGQQAAADSAAAAAPGAAGMQGAPVGRMAAMAAMAGGSRGGGGAASKYDDTIYYVTPAVAMDPEQFKILPMSMTVLIDQEHVQDFLVELENSPMSVQVMDLDLERPSSRVTKPEKGEQQASMAMMGAMNMGGMRGMMMMDRGYGGRASQMQSQMMQMQGRGGTMGGMNMMGGGAREDRKKVDTSNVNRKKDREEREKEIEKKKGPTLFDPYFNIVQVKVYGQARFFLPPPGEPEAQPSPGEVPATQATPSPGGGAAPAAAGTAAGPGNTPAPDEKTGATAPAPGPDAKSAAAPEPGAAGAPANSEAAKPADAAKPAAPPSEPAKPGADGTAAKK